MGHARIRGSRGWVTARGHPAIPREDYEAEGGVADSVFAASRSVGSASTRMQLKSNTDEPERQL